MSLPKIKDKLDNTRPTTRKGRIKHDKRKQATKQKKQEEEIELISVMIQSGSTDEEIAKKLDVSKSALKKRRQRYGIKRSEHGRPEKPKKRIHLDTSKIPDKATREEVEGRIIIEKKQIEELKELKRSDDWGASSKYYEQYDKYISDAKRRLHNLENPTEDVYATLMKGYEKRGRKPSPDGMRKSWEKTRDYIIWQQYYYPNKISKEKYLLWKSASGKTQEEWEEEHPINPQ